jgi:hypothetical protein
MLVAQIDPPGTPEATVGTQPGGSSTASSMEHKAREARLLHLTEIVIVVAFARARCSTAVATSHGSTLAPKATRHSRIGQREVARGPSEGGHMCRLRGRPRR